MHIPHTPTPTPHLDTQGTSKKSHIPGLALSRVNGERLRTLAPAFVAGFLGGGLALLLGYGALLWHSDADGSFMTGDVTGSVSDLASNAETIVDVVENVNPAVVSIVITKDVPKMETYYEQFGFWQMPRQRQSGTETIEVGGGSGFLISADGYVVTNNHVVADASAEYTVFLTGGEEYSATVIATDDVLDLALMKIEATDLPFLEFGNSDEIKVGQTVIAIGNALAEFRNTVSVGVVSGLSRSITASSGYGQSEELRDVIQTDAAINSGNSGGPLLDLDGRVIGVNVAAVLGSENIGFALPSTAVKAAIESMKTHGEVIRAYLGVRFVTVTEELAEMNTLSVDYGALVVRGAPSELAVVPGSPADKAGIEENDILLELNGVKLTEEYPLHVALREHAPDDKVTFRVLHDGEEREVTVTLGAVPSER